MRSRIILLLLIIGSITTSANERASALMSAKKLVINTTTGQTYQYIISSLQTLMIHRSEGLFVIEGDSIPTAQVKNMRFSKMTHFLMDEDSTAIAANYTIDNGLLALRRTLQLNNWNSLTIPFSMTGKQVRETFGEDARLAVVSSLQGGEEPAVEFATVDLSAKGTAIVAGSHYIIWPTREPDFKEGEAMPYTWTGTRAEGPLYITPCVSLKAKQSKPTAQNIYDNSGKQHVFISGSYIKLDDSDRIGAYIKNKRLAPGNYTVDETGHIVQNQDSIVVKAFRSWFTNLSEVITPVHFYIDGVGEDLLSAIDIVCEDRRSTKNDNQIYDLRGRKIAVEHKEALPKGIYIVKGKKIVVK